MRALLLTHVDLDGVCSAAIAKRFIGDDPAVEFSGPREISASLKKLSTEWEKIIITDISVNHDQVENIIKELSRFRGDQITWVDHHNWMAEDLDRIAKYCSLVVEHSPSAASLFFRKFTPTDEVAREIAQIGDDGDTNTNSLDNTLAYKLGIRSDNNKRYLIDAFSDGIFTGDFLSKWKKDLLQEVSESKRIVSGLKASVNSNGRKYALLDMRRKKASGTYTAKLAAEELSLDFIAVIYSCSSISFYKGLADDIDLLPVALKHQGGGHKYACGANPRVTPFERLLCILNVHYLTRELRQIIKELDILIK
ncbi:MAG: hypothetical protein JRN37_10900 [Nitrososphaerota archaeon]|jgi:oligoribonuclease NrnB/cAMP/cGMP phosphodiesterase (DHH superfamily)|nr:hypothetical protein [Nitrososphaerota archaeon]MDG7041365.1 hypothetical protein [Nitrososphaerota archaeon]